MKDDDKDALREFLEIAFLEVIQKLISEFTGFSIEEIQEFDDETFEKYINVIYVNSQMHAKN